MTTPAPRLPQPLLDRIASYYEAVLPLYGGGNPLQGRAPDARAIRMHTNDYLSLAGDRRIVEAETRALDEFGHGDSVSRVWSYHLRSKLREFEQRVAALTGAEDAIVCPSGYVANVGLVQALAGPQTPIYLDALAHQSLWEGAHSARAKAIAFRHSDAESLKQRIERDGPGLVLVDAVYSLTGTQARLGDLVEVCERSGSALVVDETHAFGAHGRDGAGLTHALGLAKRVPFRTVGFSKAVPSRGGVILCSRRHAEAIRYSANALIFSTAVLPHEVAGYGAALDIFAAEPWRREKLHANHAYLKQGLAALGYNVARCDTQILALEPGEPLWIVALREALESRGVFGAPFVPPATAQRRCLMRFSVHCGLSREDLERVLSVCAEIREEVYLSRWRHGQRGQPGLDAT